MKTILQNNPWLYGSIWTGDLSTLCRLPLQLVGRCCCCCCCCWWGPLSVTYFYRWLRDLISLSRLWACFRNDEWMNLKVRWMTTGCNHPRPKSRSQPRYFFLPVKRIFCHNVRSFIDLSTRTNSPGGNQIDSHQTNHVPFTYTPIKPKSGSSLTPIDMKNSIESSLLGSRPCPLTHHCVGKFIHTHEIRRLSVYNTT